MRYRFPENFWWGSACSALQTEGDSLNGGKSQTTWDVWFDRQPGRFHQGVGPATTSTFYQHWKQDIALLKQLKHNSFRTSLSWSRLIPDGTGEVNPEAVEFYNNVIDELLAQGITPFITLFHFDMPMVMQEKGGGENREVVEAAMHKRVLHCSATGLSTGLPLTSQLSRLKAAICMTSITLMWWISNVQPPWRITPYWRIRRRFGHIVPQIMMVKSAWC